MAAFAASRTGRETKENYSTKPSRVVTLNPKGVQACLDGADAHTGVPYMELESMPST